MAENEIRTVEYRIHSISIPDYSHTEGDAPDDTTPVNITMKFGWDLQIDEVNRLIAVEGRVIAFPNSSSNSSMFRMSTRCLFEVSTFSPLLREGRHIELPNEFVIELLGITYSTMRGILFERLAGTIYGGLILPPADAVMLFTQGREEASKRPPTLDKKGSTRKRSKKRD